MRRSIALIISSLLIAGSAHALPVPGKPAGYVNDTAGLLSPSVRQDLERTLADFEQATSNQVVVAIFPSLEGASLEDFSIRLAKQWKLGTAKKDNGIILLIFSEDRQVRIEVGYGLEGALPDAVASQIIRDQITPLFREGNYDQGVIAAVSAIIRATKGEYKTDSRAAENKEKMLASYFFFALAAFFIFRFVCYAMVFIGCIIFLGLPMGVLTAFFIVLMLEALHQAVSKATFGQTFSGGSGGFWGGSSFGGWSGGGGGFGGGGGGSFGGGGASGRW